MGKTACGELSCADGGRDIFGISDTVLLFYFPLLPRSSFLPVALVAGEKYLELCPVCAKPGNCVCISLSDLPILFRTDVSGAEGGAGDVKLFRSVEYAAETAIFL